VKVYFKTNLLGKRLLELPFDVPSLEKENDGPPPEFNYASNSATAAQQEEEAA
jgi:hypothetical protein